MYDCVTRALKELKHSATLFLQLDPKTLDADIHLYTPMSDEATAWKAELLLKHQTQNHRNLESRGITIAERILQSNVDIAARLKLPDYTHAEAFEVQSF